ncbi:N-acetyltransferase family protein [Ewingella sp. S1.OA.A_B6]
MNIRQAGIADIERLRNMGMETYRHYFGALWQSAAELQQFLDNDFSSTTLQQGLSDSQQHWWLATDCGQAAGFAKVHYYQPLPESDQQGAMLCKLYLQPVAKSRGLGAALFSHAEIQAVERQQTCLWLTVLQSNTSAIRFYERQGMSIHCESAYVTETQTTGLWVMRKNIL